MGISGVFGMTPQYYYSSLLACPPDTELRTLGMRFKDYDDRAFYSLAPVCFGCCCLEREA